MNVAVRDVEKGYGGRTVLRDLTFSAGPGTVTMLVGGNGCGKTTALRILLGMELADAGATSIDGFAYGQLADAGRRVGVALGHGAGDARLSVAACLAMRASVVGVTSQAAGRAAADAGLGHARSMPVAKLSAGMHQRLRAACALLGRPELIVLDEPFANVDADGAEWLAATLGERRREGATVLATSHQGAVSAQVDQTIELAVMA